jgi:hypothetical protein
MKYTVSIISFVLISIVCSAQEYPTWMFNNQPSCAVGISLPAVQDPVLGKEMAILMADLCHGLSNKQYNEVSQRTSSSFVESRYTYQNVVEIQIVVPQKEAILQNQTLSNGSVITLVKYKETPSNDTIYCQWYETIDEKQYKSELMILDNQQHSIMISNIDGTISCHQTIMGEKGRFVMSYHSNPKLSNTMMADAVNSADGGYELINRLMQAVKSTMSIKKGDTHNPSMIIDQRSDGYLRAHKTHQIEESVALSIDYFPVDKKYYTITINPTIIK